MRIGIFPGSFDPIHNGHVNMAVTALEQFELDRVIFVPSGISPNKRRTQKTPGSLRNMWIQKALDAIGNPKLTVSNIESKQTQVTYTLETLQTFEKAFPRASLFLIVGDDTAGRIQRWPTRDQIHRICTLLAFSREGSPNIPGTTQVSNWTPMTHASSTLKEMMREGKDVSQWIPAGALPDITKWFQPN